MRVAQPSALEQCLVNPLLAICCPEAAPPVGSDCSGYVDGIRCELATTARPPVVVRTCRDSVWIDSCKDDPSLTACQVSDEADEAQSVGEGVLSRPRLDAGALDAGTDDAGAF